MAIADSLYYFKGKVDRVIDGDTIVLSELDLGFKIILIERHVRLLGINSPELHAKDDDARNKAFEAKDYVTSRLVGQDVIIKSHEVDAFGRILGEVYLGEELINQTILDKGLAVVFNG